MSNTSPLETMLRTLRNVTFESSNCNNCGKELNYIPRLADYLEGNSEQIKLSCCKQEYIIEPTQEIEDFKQAYNALGIDLEKELKTLQRDYKIRTSDLKEKLIDSRIYLTLTKVFVATNIANHIMEIIDPNNPLGFKIFYGITTAVGIWLLYLSFKWGREAKNKQKALK